MRHKPLTGLIAAPFTPLLADGSLNTGLIPDYYRLLKKNQVQGAFICGSTGEGPSLTLEEKKRVAEAWAGCAANDEAFSLIMLLGGNCLPEARELAMHAASLHLDAVAFTSPSYFKPANVRALADCCCEVGSAAPETAFYYYHIPVLTGVNFPMIDLLKELDGRLPNFAGIKYTHEDFMDYQSCLRYGNGKFDLLWGRDENLLAALSLGAKAAVGSTYNYAAPLYRVLMEAHRQGRPEEARAWQQKSIDMIRLLSKYGGIAVGKAFMKKIGMDCGTFRLPVSNPSSEQLQAFEQDLEAIGFDQFQSRA